MCDVFLPVSRAQACQNSLDLGNVSRNGLTVAVPIESAIVPERILHQAEVAVKTSPQGKDGVMVGPVCVGCPFIKLAQCINWLLKLEPFNSNVAIEGLMRAGSKPGLLIVYY